MNGMEKDLKTIQKIAKAGKAFSKISWIFCIIGAVGCLVGIVSLVMGVDQLLKIGEVTIYGILKDESGMTLASMYAAMGAGIVSCIGGMIPAIFAERYFKNELRAGTPFTYEGAKEMKRLGILTIVVPLVSTMIAEAVTVMIGNRLGTALDISPENSLSIGLGVGLLILSVIFRYGEGLEEKEILP